LDDFLVFGRYIIVPKEGFVKEEGDGGGSISVIMLGS